ncbi:hypothetical protein NP493_20g03036 [Ridgeia piscesae]|uniref:Helicase ATP-binding domain-containing protein n=1 Tax=Ridgeia piscesae TaxID=27915 RepID=A0AAD9PE76_RIDPI|nr:hypothetical protein NP493_20g03036 [Ridgeia piscesae]
MSKFNKQTTKQTTLFQSWGGKKHARTTTKSAAKPEASTTSNQNDVIWLDDEGDEDEALDELLMTIPLWDDSAHNGPETARETVANRSVISNTVQHENKGAACNSTASLFTAVGPNRNQTISDSHQQSQPMPDCSNLPGFDPHAGRLWIYPTNYPIRDYQFNIVQTALFKNTLVALPTGLGKTFIAAVVMYNLYRWYPQGKVVFMAPTKPLVAQQIEACYDIMGIPQDDTAEMTGAMHRGKRSKAWLAQRVFYLTPQVLMNDISSGACPARLVRCLVVDEAHKAIGNHAYCQVVKELVKYKGSMRVLALSATPGTDIKAVQEVLNNLLISHIELRTEQSHDIQAYTHERTIEKVVVPLGEELGAVKEKYLEIVEVVVNRLKRHGVLYQRNVDKLSKFLLLKAREAFRQNPPENMQVVNTCREHACTSSTVSSYTLEW